MWYNFYFWSSVMIKKIILIFCYSFIISIWSCGPDLSQFQKYKKPHIITQARQKMLSIELKGDPNDTAPKAFALLYKVFYKLENAKDGLQNPFPRARWPISSDKPRSEWIGIFGIPISKKVEKLPDEFRDMNPPIKIEFWEYGTLAQILHIGPYSKEKSTIDKLMDYINKQNYIISGNHEEIYLKSQGMFFKGDENEYQTLILYPIKKSDI